MMIPTRDGRQLDLVATGPARRGGAACLPGQSAEGLRGADAAGLVTGMASLLPPVDRAVLTEGHLSVAVGAVDRMLDELITAL